MVGLLRRRSQPADRLVCQGRRIRLQSEAVARPSSLAACGRATELPQRRLEHISPFAESSETRQALKRTPHLKGSVARIKSTSDQSNPIGTTFQESGIAWPTSTPSETSINTDVSL